jgi:hypothetical protein
MRIACIILKGGLHANDTRRVRRRIREGTIRLAQGRMTMTQPLLKMTFDKAQDAYHKHYNPDHTPIHPDEEIDIAEILCWGRAWLVTLTLWDNRFAVDPGGPTLEEMVNHSMTADLDEILIAMYG